ncbi:Sporulation-specific protein 15 [Taphrina deformans PYCC 5710]|uniref:Sporulation-specific protein 15 n=1 Tax=Taphrina deformans (strain PYCC 5710 / ATCC 11124 / CBS 356.35 / IMI 108563 / JCM 9778 / NBRC 8474) TaxID=1097556 RepID=R4X8S1_TAPDE|nr:Sporulation-specific protein 15 [Taphrina deformans PYCC 5710]|eukprot:CCG81800.1 Sporulation-specific protein 15 [Taphrina deformans PYCC 5710]
MADIDIAKHRAFEAVFGHFDPSGTGSINTKDFLNLIDELDGMQPESADPIISMDQRENAAAVVDAGIAMSKGEVLDFLEELGVTFRMPDVTSHENEEGPRVEPIQSWGSVTPQALSDEKRDRRRTQGQTTRAFSNEILGQRPNMSDRDTMLLQEPHDYDDPNSILHRSHSPLAQSTPNKDSPYSQTLLGKGNRSPAHNRTNLTTRSKSYAFGPDSSSPAFSPSNRYTGSSWPLGDESDELHNQVRLLQDRDKVSERTISLNEQQIHRLETLVAESQQELSRSDRIASDLRASYAAAEATIQSLEKDVTDAHNELVSCQAKLEKAKSDLDLQISEHDRVKDLEGEQHRELTKLRAQLRMVSGDQKNAQHEQAKLLEEIESLQSRCESMISAERELVDTRRSCLEKDQIIQQLKVDLDDVKKASMRNIRSSTLDAELASAHGASVSKESQTIEALISEDDRPQHVEPTETQEEALKQHYATLSNELGLQRNLIDKMIKMKAGIKRQKLKARSNGSHAAIATTDSAPMAKDARLVDLAGSHWLVTWPLIVLYSLVFLGLGYILASQASAVNAPGVSYAELKSWERANAIDYVLEYHGVMGHASNYRWWEGGWLWVEMLGYWLEEKLIDHPWPT